MKVNKKWALAVGVLAIALLILGGYYAKVRVVNGLVKSANQSMQQENYEVAQTLFNEALMYRNTPAINQSIKLSQILIESKKVYIVADKELQDEKYMEAMNDFKKVSEQDAKRYSDAQQKAKDALSKHTAQQIQIASDLAKANKYDEAIKNLNDSLKIDVDNQEIKDLVEQYTQAIAKVKADLDAKAKVDAIAKAKADAEVLAKDQAFKLLLSIIMLPAGQKLNYRKEGVFTDNLNSSYQPPVGLHYYEFWATEGIGGSPRCFYVVKNTSDIYSCSQGAWCKVYGKNDDANPYWPFPNAESMIPGS